MSTIHDKNKKKQNSPSYSEPVQVDGDVISPIVQHEQRGEDQDLPIPQNENNSLGLVQLDEIRRYQEQAANALSLVDDVVLKNYLVELSKMDLVDLPELTTDGVILFKINKMVYEKDEYATDKFISTVGAMTYTNSSIFLVLDGHVDRTDFYLGIRCEDDERTASSIAETFKNAISGQFPGIQLEDISCVEEGAIAAKQDSIFARIKEAESFSSCVGIPSVKTSEQERTNAGFIQGIEKLSLALRGKEYTAIILAQNLVPAEIQNLRLGYENLYTQLSSQATQQLSYSSNESLANALNRTKGYSDSISHGTSHTDSESDGHTKGTSQSKTKTKGKSKENFWGKAGKFSDTLMTAGAVLTATGVGAPIGALMMGAGGAAMIGSMVGSSTNQESQSEMTGTNESDTHTSGKSDTTSENETHQENFSESSGRTATVGTSKNFTLTVHNKHIEELLKRIDKQIQRIEQAESTGLWQAGAYFLSYGNDKATAEIAATIFRSIMQGENSGVEMSAINTWQLNDPSDSNARRIPSIISTFVHPVFERRNDKLGTSIQITGTSLINSSELAMMIGLPRKSVPGLPVVEHASLAKEVVCYDPDTSDKTFNLGCIFDYGVEYPINRINLKKKSITQHVFVTGSTGCGKSETVYKLISEARKTGAKFLVIEPAKGEYKNVFGDVSVYGTHPKKTKLLRVNPFRFPSSGKNGIHVLEHIDRLVEIFNVCWPMYAAMPAILKKAVLACYEKCGWDLKTSTNKYSDDLFPTFVDLLNELESAIKFSAYSEEVKGNYIGSLVTRVESLTNGINGEIFNSSDLSDCTLFDQNVIIDLSRVGASETKSLIMGILIMRLSEYRMSSAKDANVDLRHITILEEAHNILKRTSTEQSMESSNVAGKSVEMIATAIAEMRTYGEGFIIVDQSPTSVSPAAIKNTNTKIIMRLPDADDRRIAGKSASMKDNQIDEIAKLPTGVAVIYQNDWVAPVLGKIELFKGKRIEYTQKTEAKQFDNSKAIIGESLKLLLKGRCSNVDNSIDFDFIHNNLNSLRIPTSLKIKILSILNEVKSGNFDIWKDENFSELSRIVVELLSANNEVEKAIKNAENLKVLNGVLDRFILNQASIEANLILAVRQCLMKHYGEKNDSCMRIYDYWFNDVKKDLQQ